ncbi:hypothetical protein FE257_001764 [Aspergillus nanangensis]|uniref:Uncharacterized protein n=1 Tax=Aspergillus nanangensis TaxID=2582783 RepID=A0AAD4CEN9_ASPNN|nr:hypothetical protein FE257_001764 [Aspergillus nanangensis]
MKLNILALASLLALAAAQDASTTSTGGASATTSLSPEASCAKKCGDTDRCCVAACYKVPCPSDQQANDTNECVAACPQGTGSPSDTEKYAQCQSRCFSSHFFPITDGGSQPTGASNSDATATGTSGNSDSGSNGSSGSGAKETGTGTATGTGASASSTENAAPITQVGVSAAGILGVALGLFVL